jgi:hypothetical protein
MCRVRSSSARETVETCTPTAFATSFKVVFLRPFRSISSDPVTASPVPDIRPHLAATRQMQLDNDTVHLWDAIDCSKSIFSLPK